LRWSKYEAQRGNCRLARKCTTLALNYLLVKSKSPDVPEAYCCFEQQLFGLFDGAKGVYSTWIQLRSALCSGNLNLGMKGARGRYLLVSETLVLF
jgi:hypothetical protein